MIDLSKNTNPFYPNKRLIKIMKKNIPNIKYYPESVINLGEITFLEKYNLNNNIIVTNGTMDAMNLILKTLKLKQIGIYSPTFWGIEYNANLNNYKINKIYFKDDLEYSYEELNKLSKKVGVIYICNFNNPTLSYLEKEKLYMLIKNNPNCRYIIDETTLAFNDDFEDMTFIPYIQELENVDVIISCSKIFSVSGIRIGLIFTNLVNIDNYKKNMYIYSVNIFANLLVKDLLFEFSKLTKVKKKMHKNMKKFIEKIKSSEIVNYIKDRGGSFILIELNSKLKYNEFIEYLFKFGVKVSDTNNIYPDLKEKYIRVSVGKKKELNKLANLINKYHI